MLGNYSLIRLALKFLVGMPKGITEDLEQGRAHEACSQTRKFTQVDVHLGPGHMCKLEFTGWIMCIRKVVTVHGAGRLADHHQAHCCWADRLYISLPDNTQQRRPYSSQAPHPRSLDALPKHLICVWITVITSYFDLPNADIPRFVGRSIGRSRYSQLVSNHVI